MFKSVKDYIRPLVFQVYINILSERYSMSLSPEVWEINTYIGKLKELRRAYLDFKSEFIWAIYKLLEGKK